MMIQEFVSKFRNHPVLFIGTGLSLRYLENSFTWDQLLYYIMYKLTGNEEEYYDIKAECTTNNEVDYLEIGSIVEKKFLETVTADRYGKFIEINDIFYENMKRGIKLSRFKIYLSKIFGELNFKLEMLDEISEFKKTRKNIGSVITTNYDQMIESIFDFNPLIGNDILLSNPYGSVYKIHGCITKPEKIIITKEDYDEFDEKYELIRAQLLSLFIHNPIIFLGYSMGDRNIKDILKTIFTYVDPNSNTADKIRSNFLLVEYEKDLLNHQVVEHDIVLEEGNTVRINKLKTDDYVAIYQSLSNLQLPISAMDVRKVQTIVKDIYSGGKIKVRITEDMDSLHNEDKVLVIGSEKTIHYVYHTASEVIKKYFEIIEEENIQLLNIIDKLRIQPQQYFPMYGFYRMNNQIKSAKKLMKQQKEKLTNFFKNIPSHCKRNFPTINAILKSDEIAKSNKNRVVFYSTMNNQIDLIDLENFLKEYENKDSTDYKRLLCLFDYLKYK